MAFPANLHYTRTHEWLQIDGEIATVGITEHAVELLGDLVFLDLPEVETQLSREDRVAEIESTKAVEDIYCPLSGKVVEVNDGIADNLENLKDSPYEQGWIIKLQITNPDEIKELLDSAGYKEHVESEDH